MALEVYRRKRDFGRTPEPSGTRAKACAKGKRLAYVVQKHAASHLHYDFRLEHRGVLVSWAVPKGPSLDPAQKRLAVHVEDHPLDYGSFEGRIPAGQYGAGDVIVWDRGTWEPLHDVDEGLRRGRMHFRLKGAKLRGEFTLTRMAPRDGERTENWLLIKRTDSEARPTATYDVLEELPNSAVTGRDVADAGAPRAKVNGARASKDSAPSSRGRSTSVKSARTRTVAPKATKSSTAHRGSTSPARGRKRSAKPKASKGKTSRAGSDALPRFVEPELPTLVRAAPEGSEWLHESKFDGYRVQCRIDGDDVTWLTRRGHDWTDRFASLTPAVLRLGARSALLDGEIVVLDGEGSGSFHALQQALDGRNDVAFTYFAFDLLHLDGRDLRSLALVERKERLEALLRKPSTSLRFSSHIDAHGPELFDRACELGGEGIVSKRVDSTYVSGRTREWVKVKCTRRQELVVGGWTEPEGARTDFGALLLGYYERGELRYAGRVGTGFDAKSLRAVLARLREATTPPFVDPPRGSEARGVRWARPTLVVEVEFGNWTADGRLRHASFEGVRLDKRAKDVVREEAVSVPNEDVASRSRSSSARVARPRAKRAAANETRVRSGPPKTGSLARPKSTNAVESRASRADRPTRAGGASSRSKATASPRSPDRARATITDSDTIAGVRITHPERVVAAPDVTKLDVARYYEAAAERVLEHVARRPLSLVRCPTGSSGECFFQRHATKGFPASIHEIVDPQSKRAYVWIDSLEGLIALVQMGVLELHPWGARIDALERPDRVVLDLDPDPTVAWDEVVETAFVVKDALDGLDLESFVKTTGGKGLHVTLPLARRNSWDDVKRFASGIASTLARAAPDRYVAKASKVARRGRIFVDWLRNARTATAVAPYSTRAKPALPIATPISWRELKSLRSPADFIASRMASVLAQEHADPWKGFFAVRQSISASALRSVTR